MLVLEYMQNGDLKNYLVNQRSEYVEDVSYNVVLDLKVLYNLCVVASVVFPD